MGADSAMTLYTSLSTLNVSKHKAPRAHVTCRIDMVYPSQAIRYSQKLWFTLGRAWLERPVTARVGES